MDSNNSLIQSKNPIISATVDERQDKRRFALISVLLVAFGLALIIWAKNLDYLLPHRAGHGMSARFCLPFAVGFAMLGALFANSRWRTFAGWSGLALVGQAAALQMIDAGRLIHFQHYRSFKELFDTDVFALALFALQFALVAFSLGKHLTGIKNWLSRTFGHWQTILIFCFLILAGAAVTPNFAVYATDLLFAALVQTINLANVWLIAQSIPNDSLAWLEGKIAIFLGDSKKSVKPQIDRFSLIAASSVVVLAAGLNFFVYQNHPHVPDEVQYLFQAKYLAANQLTIAAPPVPEAFAMYLIPHEEPRWFSIFPPGWPLLLAFGAKFGVIWLVNPLLAGACVLLAYTFLQTIYSLKFARLAILLLACSPWFIFMAMSFMSHMMTLSCALGAAILLQRTLKGQSKNQQTICVFISGALIGVLSLVRPLDAMIVGILFGVWILFSFQNWIAKILNAFVLSFGAIALGVLALPYNEVVTGDPLLAPLNAYYTKYFGASVMALGFGADRGFHWELDAFPGHSPLEAVVNAALNAFLLNTELFGWATGSLVLAVCFLFSGTLGKKDIWAVAAIVSVVGGYSLFWYHGGPDFGARYWFLMIVPLVALTIRGIEFLSAKSSDKSGDNKIELNPRVVLSVALLCLFSLINYLPWRALDKYYRYLEMQPGIVQLARENGFGKSLVLVRGANHPDYQSAWIYNPLNFAGDAPIYAWDKSPEIRNQLLQTYADRQIWIVDGPTLTSDGDYKIALGPISAGELRTTENY